jgi:hypothetical protein
MKKEEGFSLNFGRKRRTAAGISNCQVCPSFVLSLTMIGQRPKFSGGNDAEDVDPASDND